MHNLDTLRNVAAHAENLRAKVRGDGKAADVVALTQAEAAIQAVKSVLLRGAYGDCGAGTECVRLASDLGRTEAALKLHKEKKLNDKAVTLEYLESFAEARALKLEACEAAFAHKLKQVGKGQAAELALARDALPNV